MKRDQHRAITDCACNGIRHDAAVRDMHEVRVARVDERLEPLPEPAVDTAPALVASVRIAPQPPAAPGIAIGQPHRIGAQQRIAHGWNSTVAPTRHLSGERRLIGEVVEELRALTVAPEPRVEPVAPAEPVRVTVVTIAAAPAA